METNRLILVASDQCLLRNNYENKIMNMGLNMQRQNETLKHISPDLARYEYLYRQDKINNLIHWKICQNCDIKTRLYNHEPSLVQENDQATIL